MIGKAPKKAPAKKAPPKKAAAVKKAPPKTRSGEGKGGIFPWVTNEPGSEFPCAAAAAQFPILPLSQPIADRPWASAILAISLLLAPDSRLELLSDPEPAFRGSALASTVHALEFLLTLDSRPGIAAYAEVPMLAEVQIRAMEKWVGGGANSITSNAFSVSKFLYPKNTRK
mmetsp:Transcript_29921/g.96554  ORF Transcript_29921/g.96554 Transcript_29921/m.96554 type:complete len:171 (+) Transcript_29921:258-770(+)